MDRKGGMAAVAVLIAILGISFVPRKGGESTAPSSEASTRGQRLHQSAAKLPVRPACADIAEQVHRFFEGAIHYPPSCYQNNADDKKVCAAADGLNFAIAIVPDPAQTNLPLVFDRSIEAIQQAAQDAGYSYDASWFPWTEEKSYDRFPDEEEAGALRAETQKQPGVLAFRRGADDASKPYHGGLLVFVVGEQPTGGVNDTQFENAMAWAAKLGLDPAKHGLRILGPTFSGSLPSLARELTKAGAVANYADQVLVYSGTANSNQSIDRFKTFLCKSGSNDCPRFRTFLESDELMTHRFLQFVSNSGYKLDKVAILSEDETAFGSQPEASQANASVTQTLQGTGGPASANQIKAASQNGGNSGKSADPLESAPIHLYYPRDIATLRSAYSKQSIFSAGKGQNNAPSNTLRGDLGDAASKHDTVRTYAGELTPLAQEATLFGIVNVLQAKHIHFIVIRSSNSLDQLFLSEFLRRSYPSGRVVLDGADLLFRRGMDGDVLRGVMMLSSYPLMSWTQDLIHPVQFHDGDYQVVAEGTAKSYRIFGADLGEGTYIAARALFATGMTSGRSVSDYGAPSSVLGNTADDFRPATWLTVVGHRQFWPIAVLNCYTLSSCSDASSAATTYSTLLLPAKPAAKVEANKNAPAVTGQGRPFPADTTALLIFCCALAGAHLGLCWKGCMIGAPRVRAYFAPIPLAQQPVLIGIGSLLLGALSVTFVGATGLMDAFYGGNQFYVLWSALLFIAACGFFGFLKNYSLPVVGTAKRPAGEQATAVKHELARSAAAAGGEVSGSEAGDATVPSGSNEHGEPSAGSANTDFANAEIEHDTRADSMPSTLRSLHDRLAARQVSTAALAAVWGFLFVSLIVVRWYLNSRLTLATRTAAFWRNSHISNGVSGLTPQVLLILGMYAWFWYNLRGLSLFGEDRPVLPGEESLPERFVGPDKKPVFESQDDRRDAKVKNGSGAPLFSMFSAEQAGTGIEEAARPLSRFCLKTFGAGVLVVGFLCWLALGEQFLQALSDRVFGRLIFLAMSVAITLVLVDTLQLARTWGRLRLLLVFLDRTRLRRTLASLKGLSWGSVLGMSSNVLEERYRLISRQFESARTLQTALEAWHPANAVDQEHRAVAIKKLGDCETIGLQFAEHYVAALSVASSDAVATLKEDLAAYQRTLAKTAGRMLTHVLLPAWQREGQSLILESEAPGKGSGDKTEPRMPLAAKAHVRAAEEFFVLPYLGFIQNILGRMRTLAIGILLLFMATTLAVSSYPFSPGPALGAIFLVLFLIVGAMIVFIYAEMYRDATLSHITQTRPGELGFEFWTRIVSFGIGPLIGLLTTLFPALTDFVVSWLQPGTEMVK